MANETEWFYFLGSSGVIDRTQRRAWATDLLAMGPHGAWAESEQWQQALEGSWIDHRRASCCTSLRDSSSRGCFRTSSSRRGTCLARSEVGYFTYEGFMRTASLNEMYSHIFAPLWARSGEQIALSIVNMGNIQAEQLAFDLNMEEIGQIVTNRLRRDDLEELGIDELYDRWLAADDRYRKGTRALGSSWRSLAGLGTHDTSRSCVKCADLTVKHSVETCSRWRGGSRGDRSGVAAPCSRIAS